MKGNRAVLTAVVIVGVVLLGWWLFSRGGNVARIDLLTTFDGAQKRPDASLFSIADVTLAGETKKAIAIARPPAHASPGTFGSPTTAGCGCHWG